MNAPPEEIERLAADRNDAVDELAAQAALYEERFNLAPRLVDFALAFFRED